MNNSLKSKYDTTYKYKSKILKQMIYMHLKSHKNLQRIGKKIMISIKCKRKIYIFYKKSNKYHTNDQEISYKYMKNISIHIEVTKQTKIF